MKYFFKHSWIFILLISGYSCKRTVRGDGPVISETRDLNHASEIELSIPANITLIEADSFNCVIGAQQNVLDVIKTKTNGDAFIIESGKNFNTERPVQLVVSMPELNALTINGSGEISGLNSLHNSKLDLEVNGSGTIKLSGKITYLRSTINGSGEIHLNGSCDEQKINISGSGKFYAFDFISAKSRVEITGSGEAEINVTDELKAEITGSGNIRYKGNPHIKSDITGSGSIQKKE